jgi:hypothetical protein
MGPLSKKWSILKKNVINAVHDCTDISFLLPVYHLWPELLQNPSATPYVYQLNRCKAFSAAHSIAF